MKAALTRAKPRIDLKAMQGKAGKVASLLGALANDRRLLILCKLVEVGEATVGTLAEEIGFSQSALSQHLARMREDLDDVFGRMLPRRSLASGQSLDGPALIEVVAMRMCGHAHHSARSIAH